MLYKKKRSPVKIIIINCQKYTIAQLRFWTVSNQLTEKESMTKYNFHKKISRKGSIHKRTLDEVKRTALRWMSADTFPSPTAQKMKPSAKKVNMGPHEPTEQPCWTKMSDNTEGQNAGEEGSQRFSVASADEELRTG
uniref:Uncharacterized protein n=1 Tax=Lygus hesperus TaxID=30085 RepID=A0A0A9VVK6_LYGHE